MKTAEEYLKIWQGKEVVITKDIAIMAMKEYAQQVAEQALKDAVEKLNSDPYMTDSDIEFNRKVILNTKIKLP